MAKSKFGLLRRVKGKLASALGKIVARVHRKDTQRPENPHWEGFSDAFNGGSTDFSFVTTPESAYRLHSPLMRSPTGLFVQHTDPIQDLSWPEPIDPPSGSNFSYADLRYLGTKYSDGSSRAALSSSPSSFWETEASSDALMTSLLNGLPEIPRLRRRPGRRNLQLDRPSSHHDVASMSEISSLGHGETEFAEALDEPSQTDSSQQPRQGWVDHEVRPHHSVSEAVEAQEFALPASGGVDGSPGPTIRDDSDSPSPPSLSQAAVSDTSLNSNPQRPQNPMVQNFAVGSNTLPDPFMAGSERCQAHQLWSELSSSSDSRPSPVYQGNGVYVLHDGTIHDIQHGRRHVQVSPGSGVRSDQGDVQNVSSDEANQADRFDTPSGGSDSLPSSPPLTAIRRLHTAVSNLEGFTSPAAREAVHDLEQAVDGVVAIIDTLLDDIEVHAFNAEERRRRLADQLSELAMAHRVIQERDREINRLNHPELYGENTTPPEYASDAQQDPRSVTRTPGRVQDNNSPTPATVVRRPASEGDHSSDRQVSVTAEAGSAAPSYCTSPDTESVVHSQTLAPQVVAQGSPASSQSRESDNIMLRRTPRFRRPTL
ncbi:hypothetical protein G647_05567 [Cladophialophora carrionii CBS 160.54]|uniref:Uncharacterized protein n=1 Tax=Cladophialophora carrionii CBS 160.54 TaxID=1279043 RepID=V9DAN1_9EURO|nr:uncharacterized protein G647_05567 [Cladophialophora carrionii CBS 160.54]ETI23761.1 hypothetical protein G647_05567 [Cladophialophora carrionii CBS 160.54]